MRNSLVGHDIIHQPELLVEMSFHPLTLDASIHLMRRARRRLWWDHGGGRVRCGSSGNPPYGATLLEQELAYLQARFKGEVRVRMIATIVPFESVKATTVRRSFVHDRTWLLADW